jgi:AcrR family transcriptional regulator
MARPKEFEREDVLDEAIKVFCDRGFAGASTEAVLDAMRISRQSMYDTFGGKRPLYLEALARYNAASVAAIVRSVESAATPLAGIEAALLDFASRPSSDAALGCMGVASICEFGVSDEDINKINEAGAHRLLKAFERALAAARRGGEIAADLNGRSAAQFILAMLSGMKVAARGGATRSALRDMARMALRSLR